MNNKEFLDLLEKAEAAVGDALMSVDVIYFECSEKYVGGISDVKASLQGAKFGLVAIQDEVYEAMATPDAWAEQKEAQALKDAIALLEAKGFIVGTKT
jgi:hypothetical protein